MSKIIDALSAGVENSATSLTQSLLFACQEEGWSQDATATLSVESSKSPSRVSLKVNAGKKAQDEEYGDGLDRQPKPAIRRWTARADSTDAIVIDSIEASLGDIL